MDETPSRHMFLALRVEETTSDDKILIDDHRHGSCDSEMDRSEIMYRETHSRLNLSICAYQHQMCLRKITVISGITLQAHFSQGIPKFDTLPNHYNLLILFSLKIQG